MEQLLGNHFGLALNASYSERQRRLHKQFDQLLLSGASGLLETVISRYAGTELWPNSCCKIIQCTRES